MKIVTVHALKRSGRFIPFRVGAIAIFACALSLATAERPWAKEGEERGRVQPPRVVRQVEGINFYNLADAVSAEQSSAAAIDAAKNCNVERYDAEIAHAETSGELHKKNAESAQVRLEKAVADGNQELANRIVEDANLAAFNYESWTSFAAHLKREKARRFLHCVQRTLLEGLFPWLFPPPRRPSFKFEEFDPEKHKLPDNGVKKDEEKKAPVRTRRVSMGGTGGTQRTPGFAAGTTFNVALGREVPILFNDRNLNFTGGYAGGEYPLNTLGDAKLGIDIRGGSLWGDARATVPVGGANVAYTYLLPNPATGTTGVLAGASGQDIRIRTNGEFLWFNARLDWEMSIQQESLALLGIIGGGPVYEYSDIGHHITQQSLFFADVSSRTHLRNDNHFIGGMLRGGIKADDGNVYASLIGYVAPGVNIFDGRAGQDNRCGPCPNPGDRAFSLGRNFSNTRFAVQTGLYLDLGIRLTRSVSLELGGFHNFTSATGFLRPPTTPPEQPVRRDFDSSHRYGGRLGLRFTF